MSGLRPAPSHQRSDLEAEVQRLRDELHTASVLLNLVDRGYGMHQTEQWQAAFRAWSAGNYPPDPEYDAPEAL